MIVPQVFAQIHLHRLPRAQAAAAVQIAPDPGDPPPAGMGVDRAPLHPVRLTLGQDGVRQVRRQGAARGQRRCRPPFPTDPSQLIELLGLDLRRGQSLAVLQASADSKLLAHLQAIIPADLFVNLGGEIGQRPSL